MIEQLLTDLIAALKDNTDALRSCGGEPTPAPAVATPAPKSTKAPKETKTTPEPAASVIAETPAPAEEPVATPEPEPAETEVEAVAFPKEREAGLLLLAESVQAIFSSAGPQLTRIRANYEALRAKYGVKLATELKDDQIEPFYNDAMEAIKLD